RPAHAPGGAKSARPTCDDTPRGLMAQAEHHDLMLPIILVVLLGLAVLGLAAFVLLGRGSTIARGRFGRLAIISRMSARLPTSRIGAAIRRRFTSKARRAAYDESRRRADAEAVTRTMGQMKGAFMKLGQMMSFVSDDVPPEYRAALQALQAK